MTITISLTYDQVDDIQSLQERIVVVRNFQATDGYLVIATAFSPFGESNTVELLPQWTIYASEQTLTAGSLVSMQVTAGATVGNVYPFAGLSIGLPSAAYSPAAIGFDNQTGQDLLFGLAQPIQVNGQQTVNSPVAIVQVPANQTTYLEPLPEVYIFLATNLAAAQIQPAGILNQPAAAAQAALPVPFSVGTYLAVSLATDTTIYFESATNSFTLNAPTTQ